MGTKLNTVIRLRNGSVKYNGYVYRPGQKNQFSPDDLDSMQAFDVQIELEYAERQSKLSGYKNPGKNLRLSMLTPAERKARRAQQERERHARNREVQNKRRREVYQQKKQARLQHEPQQID